MLSVGSAIRRRELEIADFMLNDAAFDRGQRCKGTVGGYRLVFGKERLILREVNVKLGDERQVRN